MVIAGLIVTGLTLYVYKPTYSVTLNNEFIGYTQDKSGLQKKINDYIKQGENNIAFIQIDNMPEYHLCMLKKNISTNDNDIYNQVISKSTAYYRYYALLNDGEEQYYFKNFDDAQAIVNKLKDKNSANIEKITVIEKYDNDNNPIVKKLKDDKDDTQNVPIFQKEDDDTITIADADNCVSKLYEEKKVIPKEVKIAQNTTNKGVGGIPADGTNSSDNVTGLGITLVKPLSGIITSRFGRRPRDFHKGLDIAAPTGSSIYAAASGTAMVSSYGYNGGYGNYIILTHENGVQTVYGHCSALCISQGDSVSQGQLIAKVGATGDATGPHLHFEIRKNGVAQNPQNYLY